MPSVEADLLMIALILVCSLQKIHTDALPYLAVKIWKKKVYIQVYKLFTWLALPLGNLPDWL